jgi:hypothetical protein
LTSVVCSSKPYDYRPGRRQSGHAYFRDTSNRRNSAMQPQPHPHLQLKLRPPSPQGFGGGGPAFPPMHGAGIGVGAASSSSSQAAAAGSARAAAQMAYEDAWKASHPDFRTPFSSLEDAVTRCADLDPLSLPRRCRRRRRVVVHVFTACRCLSRSTIFLGPSGPFLLGSCFGDSP